jgi:hypothetical protein
MSEDDSEVFSVVEREREATRYTNETMNVLFILVVVPSEMNDEIILDADVLLRDASNRFPFDEKYEALYR